MRIIAISRDQDWYRIGESQQSSQWYGVVKVADHVKDLAKGDIVEIKSEKDTAGKNQLSYIKKTGSSGGGGYSGASQAGASSGGGKSYGYQDSPEKTDVIRRQAVGHMVSRTLSGVQMPPEEMEATIRSLYKLYLELATPEAKSE